MDPFTARDGLKVCVVSLIVATLSYDLRYYYEPDLKVKLMQPLADINPNFSNTYDEARAKFQTRAQAAGAELFTEFVDDDKMYSIDVAVLKGADATDDGPLLLHFSGTHGGSGYSGSGIQCAFLEGLMPAEGGPTTDVPAGVTVALVHMVNPVGAAGHRRFNEHNVDLNRNVLPAEKFAELKDRAGDAHDAYMAIDDLLNPGKAWDYLDELLFWPRVVLAVFRAGGVTALKRAIVSAQYHSPDKMYYGGQGLEPSHAVGPSPRPRP